MLKQIKKMPRYFLKLLRNGNKNEFLRIVKDVKFEHLLIALAARLDRNPTCVNFRALPCALEINDYLELMTHRRQKIEDDIYLWDFGPKQLYCNYIQLTGLHGEYLCDLFDEIYKYDWRNKRVVDIGGFIGDTALFFLSQGAKKVFIYEPVEKNVKSLRLNLKGKENSIECYQKALADKNGPVSFFSKVPECSSSFGNMGGEHRIDCAGITIGEILKLHYPIDAIKVDCEGGEIHLLGMSKEQIRSVPYWIVETHTKELYHNIINKFTENGFKLTYDKALSPEVNLLHFNLIETLNISEKL